MDYLTLDQCKNLKEWGLPQSTPLQYFSKVVGEGSYLLHEDSDQFPGINPVACPSLEELIEWLGDQSFLIVFNRNSLHLRKWVAIARYTTIGEGETPLEAVYALVLAIKGGGDD